MTTEWQDLLRPVTLGTKGIRKGPLVRWYSTNTFYFVPVITGDILSNGAKFGGIAQRKEGESFKVTIPDPLTFADCSDDEHYGSREKVIFAYCDGFLKPEMTRLERAGVRYVQFSAPSLVARGRNKEVPKDELRQAGEGLRSALHGTNLQSGYHTYFGDASPCFKDMLDLIPTNDIGVDLTETDASKLDDGKKGLIAGVVDSRSSYVETVADIDRRLGSLRDKFRRVILAPSCDLQYVPRAVADIKMKNLAEAKERLQSD